MCILEEKGIVPLKKKKEKNCPASMSRPGPARPQKEKVRKEVCWAKIGPNLKNV
jgi:hypothetical protein